MTTLRRQVPTAWSSSRSPKVHLAFWRAIIACAHLERELKKMH